MEFDFKALRESRKAVAQKIAENLLLYGDLEAPNSGYGSHGTQDHIVAMGSANYLRYLAYIQNEPNGSQHFLTEPEAAKEGLAIKRGTEPLILERWTVDAAKEYHAFDLPVYPVHHMEGEHKALTAYMRRDLLRQHQPSRAALAKFFENAGVLQKDAPQDTETLYHAARAYAKQKFPEISTNQACFVHLLMKQNGIQPDYPHEPLLTAEEVKRYIQEAPNLIFSSISRASKEAKKVQQELRFVERQLKQDKEVNAHPYIAICKESDLAEMQKRGLFIETLPKDTLHDFVTFSPGQWETNEVLGAIDSQDPETIDTAKEDPYICLGQQQELSEGLVAFTTKASPDDDRWLDIDRAEENGFPKRVLYTMPKEDVSRIKDLSAITLQYKSYAISDSLEVENSSLTFRGLKAIQWFRSNVVQDDTAYKEALEKRMYLPGMAPKRELVLSCEGKPIFSMRYQEGRGDLAKAVPHYLPETLPEKYQKACETVKRYRMAVHQRRWPDEQTQASTLENPAPFPTIEESREALAKDLERYVHESKGDESRATAKFYTLYPFADPAVDTPKKAILGAISEMAKDGYTIARIESVLTHISTERTSEALETLESPEGKQAIRKARKVLHLVQDSKGKSASR
jgi:hypothetical protein